LDKEILRTGIIAELDAVNLYEQMADMTQNENIRKVLLDIAKEEKTHVGEFQTLLLKEDKEQEKELEEGKKEIEELTE
jgi:rubrerythrin